MRYVVERYKREQRDMAYRIYVTDCLRTIVEVTTLGNVELESYNDLINPKPVDDRTGEEIAAEILGKAGLEVNA